MRTDLFLWYPKAKVYVYYDSTSCMILKCVFLSLPNGYTISKQNKSNIGYEQCFIIESTFKNKLSSKTWIL